MAVNKSKVLLGISTWFLCSLTASYLAKIVLDIFDLKLPIFYAGVNCLGTGLLLKNFIHRYEKLIPRYTLTFRIILISILNAVDNILGYSAYSNLPLSAIIIIKNSNIVTTYLCNVLMQQEKADPATFFVITWIFLSICLTLPSLAITSDQILPCLVIFISVVISSFKWTLVSMELKNEFVEITRIVYVTQLIAGLITLPFSFFLELPTLLKILDSGRDVFKVIIALLFCMLSIILVTILILAEYVLVRITSILTVVMAGVGKEFIAIGLSIYLFDESVKLSALWGLTSSAIGISLYSLMRKHVEKHLFKENEEFLGIQIVS